MSMLVFRRFEIASAHLIRGDIVRGDSCNVFVTFVVCFVKCQCRLARQNVDFFLARLKRPRQCVAVIRIKRDTNSLRCAVCGRIKILWEQLGWLETA